MNLMRMATAVLLAATLSACGTNENDQGDPMDATRNISQAVADYDAFAQRLIDRLAEKFGPRDWKTSEEPATRALCGVDDSGVEVILPRRTFAGAYAAADRDAVRDLVIAVGKEAGFAEPDLVVDKPDYLKIVGEDAHGGRYTFTSSVNTVLSTWTGCHPAD